MHSVVNQAPTRLPTEILEEILHHAGPLATARAASVDTHWHQAATSTHLWRQFYADAPFCHRMQPLPKSPPAGHSWQAWYGAHYTVDSRLPQQLQMHRAQDHRFDTPEIVETTMQLAINTLWMTFLIPAPLVVGALAGAFFLTAGAGLLLAGSCVVLSCAAALALVLPLYLVLWAMASSSQTRMLRFCLPQLFDGVGMATVGAIMSALSFLTVQYCAVMTAVMATLSALLGTATLLNAVNHHRQAPHALSDWWASGPLAAQHRRISKDLEATYMREAALLKQQQAAWTA